MEKLYIVLWAGKYDNKWFIDGVYADEAIANAKLKLEQLTHPEWNHCVVVTEAPKLEVLA